MNKSRWFETLSGVALVAAWALVAWTTETGMREQDLADRAKAAAVERAATSAPPQARSEQPAAPRS